MKRFSLLISALPVTVTPELLSIITEAIASLGERFSEKQLRAVFLTGSFAAGREDFWSDIDLLLLVRKQIESKTRTVQGREVELTFLTERSCREAILKSAVDNNNYVLNSLAQAIVLYDSEDVGQSLVVEAAKLYRLLPAQPSHKERLFALDSLERLARSARRYTQRASDNASFAPFARMRNDLLFSRSIYLACWCMGERTTALPALCQRLINEGNQIGSLTKAYLSTHSLGESSNLAEEIFGFTQKMLSE